MGKLITKKIRGMNLWAKVALTVLFTFVLSVFMYEGWYKPKQIQAAVSAAQPFPDTPTISGTTSASVSGSYTINAGSNRLLVVAVSTSFTNTPSTQSVTVTYGGQALTQMAVSDVAQRRFVWIGYLRESGISAASGTTLQVSLANTTNLEGTETYAAVFTGVDQTTPVNATYSIYNNNTTAILDFGAGLAVNAGGYSLYGVSVNNSTAPTISGDTGYTLTTMNQVAAGINYAFTGSKAFASAGTADPVNTFAATVRGGIAAATLNPASAGAPGSIQLSASSYSVAENGTNVTVTATRTGGSTGAVGISYATSNGTATAGSDYTAASGTLSWAAGDAANKTFTVNITNDTIFEGNETFTATLSSPTGGATLGTPSSATVTITDNDTQPTVQWTAASQSSAAESGTMIVTAQLSNASTSAVSIPFTVTGTATSGTDYTITASPITIAAGSTTGTATITITSDTTVEPNETVILTMGTPTNATLGATTVHTATITNDDVALPTVQWTAASQASVAESGTMTVTAQLSSTSASAVTVPFTVTGTATNGTDYTITASPITIAAGSTTGTATITITSDTTVEPNETVILTMGTPTNATLGTTTVHTATITNDDSAAVNSTAAGTATAVASSSSSITVTAPYTNDSNGNNTLKVEWGTGGTYSLGTQTLSHAASPYVYNIPGLLASTAYNVRVTYQDADTVTGTAVQTFTPSTPAYTSPLMHTATNINPGDTKGYGLTWGSTFTCETCHAQGTSNVKLIATSVDTPNGPRNVVFTRMTASLNSQNGVFGNDARTYAGNGTGGSSNICEVCHRKTAFHRYSTNAPTLTHYNNDLCITCHTHALGFKASGGHLVPIYAAAGGHSGCASGIGCHANTNPTAPYPTAGTAPDCRACHTKADPTTANIGCGSCHGAANGNGEPVGTVYPDVAGSHAKHTVIPTACTYCHDTGGTGGNADHGKGNRGANPAVVNLAASFTWNGTTCSTTTCHANVYGTGSIASPAWGTSAGCNACHTVAIGANGPATGSHTAHAGSACTQCHAAGTTTTTAPNTGHADGNIDVINGYPANVTKHTAGTYTGTCSTASCHANVYGTGTITTPVWGTSAGCSACHTVAIGVNGPATGSHDLHAGTACTGCHSAGTTQTTSPTTGHADGDIDVINGYPANVTKHAAGTYTGTCTTSLCHGTTSPTWGANTANNTCTKCHGTPSTVGSNANMAPSIGAHQVHVHGTGTYNYSRELTCYECHNSGTTIGFTNHMNGNTQNVVFTNASTARDNGYSAAAWTAGTYPNGTCSVYCHGASMLRGDTSGTAKTPSWTANLMTGAAANDCALCHGNPPTAGTASPVHSGVSASTSCTSCHTNFNAVGGFDSEANRRLHIDGILQVSTDCNACHDYDTVGATYTGGTWSGGYWGKFPKATPNAYGEHAKHINYIKNRLGYTVALNAVAQTYGAAGSDGVKVCGTCHSIDPAAHTINNSSARSIFPSGHPYLMGGTGGTSLLFGSSNPAYSVAAKTCSNISCHYFTTPTW